MIFWMLIVGPDDMSVRVTGSYNWSRMALSRRGFLRQAIGFAATAAAVPHVPMLELEMVITEPISWAVPDGWTRLADMVKIEEAYLERVASGMILYSE